MSDKRTYERAVKKSVSFPVFLYDQGTDRQRQLRFPTFSDYLQELIRRDTVQTGNFPPGAPKMTA